ncbi:ABC transporter permease [Corynebacterium poyangense]|uniref:ABC transporter permease n=1 Tax=Corynebacterium poyangense TaxID=2684405 RepID=A0A7H0SN41_9CORY|nr:ABC transporter permease [Corynebacterium poyangense]MBZ8176982.1 ABC transporter permease [Corynebacterium poyangense]QNQ89966.1 ABC transporter permease [Corynebacterium poyangense]
MSTLIRTLQFSVYDLSRLARNWSTLFFSVALPVFFYLLFGANQDYSNQQIGNGNVAAYVMIGMALYAGATGSVVAVANSVVEHETGWGRQLALTPLTQPQILISNLLNILVRAALPVTAVNIAGVFTGASMPAAAWIASYFLTILTAVPIGFYGLAWGMLMPTANSVSLASGSIVLLAFAGNVFMPLTEGLMKIGRYTPMYGLGALARWPLTEGIQETQTEPYVMNDSFWFIMANIICWTLVFIFVCVLLRKRDKGRR